MTGFTKKVLAFTLCVTTLLSTVFVTSANEEGEYAAPYIQTVSDGDASAESNSTVSGSDLELLASVSDGDLSPAFEGVFEDAEVHISISAEPGVLPEGAQLVVTPVTKTEVNSDMSEDEKAEVESVNALYDETAAHLDNATSEEEEQRGKKPSS